MIRADHGGCVSVLGPTDIEFVALSNAYIQSYCRRLRGSLPHDR
jgi:hypothetical protein